MKLTNKEASEWLIAIKRDYIHGGDEDYDERRKLALDMGAEALENQKTGHWIFKNDNIAIPTGYYQCSECEEGKLLNKDNFCPNCGAKMTESEQKVSDRNMVELVIKIDENVFTRLFDNGIQDNEIAVDDICEMARALRMGTPLEEALENQKTGHWIEQDGYDGDTYYDCSECGESFCLIEGTPTDNLYKYCPNCGAKMKGE